MTELRHRALFKHRSIAQLQDVGTFLGWLARDGSQPFRILVRICHLPSHVAEHRRVVSLHQGLAGQVPKLRQPLIERTHVAIKAAHQHAIGRRIQRGP